MIDETRGGRVCPSATGSSGPAAPAHFTPLIVAEIEFGQISLQMSLADVVIRPIDRALHDGKVALNGVGVNVAANVIASTLVDGTVQRKLAADFLSGPAFVRHDLCSAVDLSPDDWAQIVRANGGDMMRAHLAVPLDEREHRFLANSARSEVLALAAVFVLLQSANERFVKLDHLAFAASCTVK